MLYIINRWLQKLYIKKHTPKVHKILNEEMTAVFEEHGDGIYLANFVAVQSDWISKIIGWFSGGYSHSVLVLYTKDFTQYLNNDELMQIQKSWDFYYGEMIPFPNPFTNALVLASADQEGMMCFDYSVYQNRKQTLRKLTSDFQQIRDIITYIISRLNVPYDATGLAFWLIKHGDDPNADFCSEICYDACDVAGIKIAENGNPSPYQIEQFNKDLIIFEKK